MKQRFLDFGIKYKLLGCLENKKSRNKGRVNE